MEWPGRHRGVEIETEPSKDDRGGDQGDMIVDERSPVFEYPGLLRGGKAEGETAELIDARPEKAKRRPASR